MDRLKFTSFWNKRASIFNCVGEDCVEVPARLEQSSLGLEMIFPSFQFTLVDILTFFKFASSYTEARKLIQSNAIRINREIVNNTKHVVTDDHFNNQGFLFITKGKSLFKVVVFVLVIED